MKQKWNTYQNTVKMVFGVAMLFIVSCEEAFEFDLPDTGDLQDNILPQANFSTTPDPIDFRVIKFTNASSESTEYLWDFKGNGVICDTITIDNNIVDGSTETQIVDSRPISDNLSAISTTKFSSDSLKIHGVLKIGSEFTSTLTDLSFVRFAAGEGDYEAILTASDANDASGVSTKIIEVRDVFVPINPIIANGDFENKTFDPDWGQINTDGFNSTTPNTSSDGSWLDYDGADTGSKTGGMKFSAGASTLSNASGRRFAYQPLKVSETTADRTVKYIVEYEYSIKSAATPGSNITLQILDGHFDAVADALNSTPLVEEVNDDILGNTNFTTIKKEFTSNGSGEVAIFIYASTDQDAYVDNVKVYPKP